MTDLFDDDLFAARPLPPRHAAPAPPPAAPAKPARRIAWRENTGEKPHAKAGARVAVELANGSIHEGAATDRFPAWPVETTRWSLTGSPFDVARFRVL